MSTTTSFPEPAASIVAAAPPGIAATDLCAAEATETDAWATVEPAAKLVFARDAIGFQPEEGETP